VQEMTMSLAFQNNEEKKYGTRTEVHYLLHVPYYKIAEAIKDGKLALHLIDNKVQINIAEAKTLLGKKSNLF
jgi:hypothetical protein